MRKVDNGEKKKEKKKRKKIMTFIVATNVIASRPTERRPTGTPHARANFINIWQVLWKWNGKDILYGIESMASSNALDISYSANQ